MKITNKKLLKIIKEEVVNEIKSMSERLDQRVRSGQPGYAVYQSASSSASGDNADEEFYGSVKETDWSSIRDMLSTGTSLGIYEPESRTSWNVVYGTGSNHGDVEPASSGDTDKQNSAFGGPTWNRKGVVVTLPDGSKVAASLHNMGHAGLDDEPWLAQVSNRSGGFGSGKNLDYVKGNNVDGHMCLHFIGSTHHFDGLPDKRAQAEIKKILKMYKNTGAGSEEEDGFEITF